METIVEEKLLLSSKSVLQTPQESFQALVAGAAYELAALPQPVKDDLDQVLLLVQAKDSGLVALKAAVSKVKAGDRRILNAITTFGTGRAWFDNIEKIIELRLANDSWTKELASKVARSAYKFFRLFLNLLTLQLFGSPWARPWP